MCWHNYTYRGWVTRHKWLMGVAGGIQIEVDIEIKKCTKCGKEKEV